MYHQAHALLAYKLNFHKRIFSKLRDNYIGLRTMYGNVRDILVNNSNT